MLRPKGAGSGSGTETDNADREILATLEQRHQVQSQNGFMRNYARSIMSSILIL